MRKVMMFFIHIFFICNKLKIFEFASVSYNRIPFMQTHASIQNDAIPGHINNRKLHRVLVNSLLILLAIYILVT